MKHKNLAVMVSGLLLVGCSTLPSYVPEEGDETTMVNIKEVPRAWLCIDDKKFQLKADENNNALIPVGERLTIGNSYYSDNGVVTYRCNPAISFVPKAGENYFANWEIESNRCRVEVYKFADINRVGLDFEKTTGRSICSAK
ncbi:hypothetical protein [Vibrio paucivorans]